MNPTVPQRVIDAAYARNPDSASAEYGAQFRRDIETFIQREVIDALIIPGRYELPYVSDTDYVAFVDPSGGSQDSMTLAIAHRVYDENTEEFTVVLDAIRERKPPFSPQDVVREFADLIHRYDLSTVTGDRYGGEWPREAFRRYDIEYELSGKPKSDLYRELLPMLNSGQVELLDNSKFVSQLLGLERRKGRSGRDAIDHAPNAHDDVAKRSSRFNSRLQHISGTLTVYVTYLSEAVMLKQQDITQYTRRLHLIKFNHLLRSG